MPRSKPPKTLVEHVEQDVDRVVQAEVKKQALLEKRQGQRPFFVKEDPPEKQAALHLGKWAVSGYADPTISESYWSEVYDQAAADMAPGVQPHKAVGEFNAEMHTLWQDPELVRIALQSLSPEDAALYQQLRAEGRHPGLPPSAADPELLREEPDGP
jgi:hypothetical protein